MDPLEGKRLLFVVNEARFLVSHRGALLAEARRRGMQLIVICGARTGEAELEAQGVEVQPIRLTRSAIEPWNELTSYRRLVALYQSLEPDICHHVTIKPVIYGTRAAQVARVPAVVNAIPGMGFVFIRRGMLANARRWLVNLLYRYALRHPNMRVIFQNSEDRDGFFENRLVPRDHAVLIRGSGVDLTLYPEPAPPVGPVTFVLVGRMLNHKGVTEFVRAAQILCQDYPEWRFLLVGDVDPGNPSSLTTEQLEHWRRKGIIDWLGFHDDVPELLREAHVVVLPSYREGLPKTLLEASAAGRPMIATDVPGCREVIRDGMNGILVPPRDPIALANAMRRLGNSRDDRHRMGRAARVRAEALYNVDDVVRDTFLVYEQLLARA
ncbi:MAG: glycosyltransferase family 4 protein [Pseudomonadota bacterium]